MCRLSWNLEPSASLNPQVLSRPVIRLFYLYTSQFIFWKPILMIYKIYFTPYFLLTLIIVHVFLLIRVENNEGFKSHCVNWYGPIRLDFLPGIYHYEPHTLAQNLQGTYQTTVNLSQLAVCYAVSVSDSQSISHHTEGQLFHLSRPPLIIWVVTPCGILGQTRRFKERCCSCLRVEEIIST